MKTKEQMLKWLDAQPWAIEFYREAFLDRANDFYFCDTLLAGAFRWATTTQGRDVWQERNMDFLKWYDSDDKPMSWEEYCEQNPIEGMNECYIDGNCCIESVCTSSLGESRDADTDANVMSKDLCEAFLAYMKLIQLRNAWVKDGDKTGCCFRILTEKDSIVRKMCLFCTRGLSFPTPSMADEFIETFKDLLEVAKPLL